MPITADDITWVYCLLLGRPARPHEVEAWCSVSSAGELRERCMESAEFRGSMRRRGLPMAQVATQLVSAPGRLPIDIATPSTIAWRN